MSLCLVYTYIYRALHQYDRVLPQKVQRTGKQANETAAATKLYRAIEEKKEGA